MSVDERAREDILALSDTILETREAVTRLERKQNQHGRILTALQQGLTEVRSEVAELRSEVRADISELRSETAELRSTVGEILSLLRER